MSCFWSPYSSIFYQDVHTLYDFNLFLIRFLRWTTGRHSTWLPVSQGFFFPVGPGGAMANHLLPDYRQTVRHVRNFARLTKIFTVKAEPWADRSISPLVRLYKVINHQDHVRLALKIRRQDRLRCGNSLNACSKFLLQLYRHLFFLEVLAQSTLAISKADFFS